MALILFFVVTFGLTWGLWLVPDAAGIPRRGAWALGGPVFLLGVFAPGIVAIAFTAVADGRAGVSGLLEQVVRWRAPWQLYAVALLFMVGTELTAAAIVRVVSGAWPPFGDTRWPLLFAAAIVTAWSQAGEEIGWRGYALPRLATTLRIGPGSLALGVIWASWHLPLFFIPGTGSDGQSFPLYALHVTALSVVMGWLYWRSGGSVLLPMLMHSAVNNTTVLVPTAVAGASEPFSWRGSPVGWVAVVLAWVVAAWCLHRLRAASHVHDKIRP